MSVKNYSPLLLDIFRLGSEKEFKFDCGSNKAAFAFRHRLHALRRELRKEKHWLTPVAEAVVISIPKNSSFIIAHPPDDTFKGRLEKELIRQGLKKDQFNAR